jgi:sugar lactone lactonase YvrE
MTEPHPRAHRLNKWTTVRRTTARTEPRPEEEAVVRRVALTVLLAGVLALTSGGIAVAQPGHQDVNGRFPATIDLPNGFQPEGISTGKGTSFYVGSVASGAIFRGDLRTGKGAILVKGDPGNKAATGNKVDKRNRLWVSGASTGTGTVYDADTGYQLESYQFVPVGTASFINDVIVTKDAAYFTDSVNQDLYVVPIGRGGRIGSTFKTLPLTGDLVFGAGFNSNGIEASPDGDTLLVIQSNTGFLFKVNPKTGVTKKVDLGTTTLPAGDGLLLQDRTILNVVQNAGQITVLKLDRSYNFGKVIDVITSPNSPGVFDVPTTAAAFGKFLYVVNARFGIADPDTAAYTVVQVDAFKGH